LSKDEDERKMVYKKRNLFCRERERERDLVLKTDRARRVRGVRKKKMYWGGTWMDQ
jgi:hypothetical protein